jgi:hypothetical protein
LGWSGTGLDQQAPGFSRGVPDSDQLPFAEVRFQQIVCLFPKMTSMYGMMVISGLSTSGMQVHPRSFSRLFVTDDLKKTLGAPHHSHFFNMMA